MIGIVIVSHSLALAEAAHDFASTMAPNSSLKVEIAAGDAQGELGTSATKIASAIKRAASGDGVWVVVDLGSALLNSEMAVDLAGASNYEIVVSASSLVEGLTAAMATAARGASLTEVELEACRASNLQQLSLPETPQPDVWSGWDDAAALETTARIVDKNGLHARPSARLAQAVASFDAQVRIRNSSRSGPFVDASSITNLMTLGASAGDVMTIESCGRQAQETLDQLRDLLSDGTNPAESNPEQELIGVSSGVAVGPVVRANRSRTDWMHATYEALSVSEEQDRFNAALEAVKEELLHLAALTRATTGDSEALIIDSARNILDDFQLLNPVRNEIQTGTSALQAWVVEVSSLLARVESLPEPYQRQRATDIRDLRDRVAAELAGVPASLEDLKSGIIVAAELSAADVAQLDPKSCLGIATTHGSRTSHASILARSLSIPAIVGVSAETIEALIGRTVLLDASASEIIVDPTDEQIEQRTLVNESNSLTEHEDQAASEQKVASHPVTTSDGLAISVGANVALPDQAVEARAAGADSVGLLRTEFMFANWAEAPSADQHYQAYADIANKLDGRPLTIRTFDSANDKPISFLGGNLSEGPRGLQLSLAYPRVLGDQLSAIARLSFETPVRLLFPYVTNAREITEVKNLLVKVAKTHTSSSVLDSLKLGAMIEAPGAVLDIKAIAEEVDFLSIGTNDLSSEMFGLDRRDPGAYSTLSAFDPAVLRLLKIVATEREELPISVCGELANEQDAVPLLIGLGIDQLSVRPSKVSLVKDEVTRWAKSEATDLATKALELRNGEQVRDLVQQVRANRGLEAILEREKIVEETD